MSKLTSADKARLAKRAERLLLDAITLSAKCHKVMPDWIPVGTNLEATISRIKDIILEQPTTDNK